MFRCEAYLAASLANSSRNSNMPVSFIFQVVITQLLMLAFLLTVLVVLMQLIVSIIKE